MKRYVLLFRCQDQVGVVARISSLITAADCTIVNSDQHSSSFEGGVFFIRVEFCPLKPDWQVKAFRTVFYDRTAEFGAEWQLFDMDRRLRMGVLVSRQDHCLAELLNLWQAGDLLVDIPFVISNHPDHRELVQHYGVSFVHIPADTQDKKESDLLAEVGEQSDFLVLARYMQVLSSVFLADYQKDIINIHHSFLPSFVGANPYKQAYDRGVKLIGATAHFVTEDLDAGPIIAQDVSVVSHRDGIESMVQKGKIMEKVVLAQAVQRYVAHQVIRFENKTIVFA